MISVLGVVAAALIVAVMITVPVTVRYVKYLRKRSKLAAFTEPG